jgi:maltokinase
MGSVNVPPGCPATEPAIDVDASSSATGTARAASRRAPRLGTFLRGLHGTARFGREGATLSVEDWADLAEEPPVRLLIIHADQEAATRFAVWVSWDQDGHVVEAHGSGAVDRAVCRAVARRSRIRTQAGGEITFDGQAGQYGGSSPLDHGWSSNNVSLVRISGTTHVHKAYRRLDPDNHEAACLTALRGTAQVAAHRADYSYRPPGEDAPWPLGVIYEYISGSGVDGPLRESLRGLWSLPSAEPGKVSRHMAPLRALASAAGAFLAEYHRATRSLLGSGPLDRATLVADFTAEVDAVAMRLTAGSARDRAECARMAAILRSEAARLGRLALGGPALESGHAHGDLHLGHLLVRPSGLTGPAFSLLDLSPKALNPGDRGFDTQLPWQDLASLDRALDYFTSEEVYHRVGELVRTSWGQACHAALRSRLRLPTGEEWTPQGLRCLREAEARAASWSRGVKAAFLTGYLGEQAVPRHPILPLLRLRRLVHELSYELTHQRDEYRLVAFNHLVVGAARSTIEVLPAGTAVAAR